MASASVSERFADIGLQPAGDDGTCFQRVPLLKAPREREGARFTVNRNGRSIALRLQDQFLPQPGFDAAQAQVEAPAVFVGTAVPAPALGVDNFKGLDRTGQHAVLFAGTPERSDNDRRPVPLSSREKLREVEPKGELRAMLQNTDRTQI